MTAHAIVVLGAAVTRAGEPSAALRERLRVALRLAVADPSARVVVSGGSVRGRPAEAPVMAAWLARHGVAAGRLLVEADSRSTWQNAERVAPILRQLGVVRVSLVTQRFHGRRALACVVGALRRAGCAELDVTLHPAADPWRPLPLRALAPSLERLKALNEATVRRLLRRLARGARNL